MLIDDKEMTHWRNHAISCSCLPMCDRIVFTHQCLSVSRDAKNVFVEQKECARCSFVEDSTAMGLGNPTRLFDSLFSRGFLSMRHIHLHRASMRFHLELIEQTHRSLSLSSGQVYWPSPSILITTLILSALTAEH